VSQPSLLTVRSRTGSVWLRWHRMTPESTIACACVAGISQRPIARHPCLADYQGRPGGRQRLPGSAPWNGVASSVGSTITNRAPPSSEIEHVGADGTSYAEDSGMRTQKEASSHADHQ